MPEPILKQIKSTLANALIILFVAPMGGVGLTYLNGELTGWKDVPKALDHGLFIGFCMTFAWIAMASPIGVRFRTLISSIRSNDEGLKEELNVQVAESSDPQRTVTATVDPKTQKITVKEEAKPTDKEGK